MKTVCFQAKQIDGLMHRIDVKFQVVPTSCTSQLSFEVIISLFFWFNVFLYIGKVFSI